MDDGQDNLTAMQKNMNDEFVKALEDRQVHWDKTVNDALTVSNQSDDHRVAEKLQYQVEVDNNPGHPRIVIEAQMSKKLIDCATSTQAFDNPRMHDAVYKDDTDKRSKRFKTSHQELTEDLKIAKEITKSILKDSTQRDENQKSAEKILESAIHRENNNAIVFVDVTDEHPASAARRVLAIKDKVVENEVVPVDLTGVLDDVTLKIVEEGSNVITSLVANINVKESISDDDLPKQLWFYIPEDDKSDKTKVTRYVHLDSMPDELKKIIRTYLSLTTGTVGYSDFVKSINELLKTAKQKRCQPIKKLF